jgi:hypothetical protein
VKKLACVTVLLLACSVTGARAQSDTKAGIYYLVEAPAVARESPSSTAKVVNRYPAGSIVSVTDGVTGWARVKPATTGAQSDNEGWIAANPANLIPDDVFSATLRSVKVKDKPWPAATKNAIIKKQARIGFTREQVAIALGDPLRESSEETTSGTTELLIYPGQAIKLTAGRVSSIVKSK